MNRALKILTIIYVVFIAAVRATVYAALVAALVMFASELLKSILLIDLKNLFFLLLITPLFIFPFWMLLVRSEASEVVLETPLSGSGPSLREPIQRALTPIAVALGGLVLFGLLPSRPMDIRWPSGQEPLLALAIGYSRAPLLYRKRFLRRLVESLGAG